MRELQLVLAGFGGQGVLFAGKVVASAGLLEDRELSWLPSYGPEMRGGTANCSVTLSDNPIGSPLIMEPNALIAMNQPSFDKFIETVVPGGIVVIDFDYDRFKNYGNNTIAWLDEDEKWMIDQNREGVCE